MTVTAKFSMKVPDLIDVLRREDPAKVLAAHTDRRMVRALRGV